MLFAFIKNMEIYEIIKFLEKHSNAYDLTKDVMKTN